MDEAEQLQSGKGHRDENFPVASLLIHPRHREAVLAFYRFARTADDIADHAEADADEKLTLLEAMRASLEGEEDSIPEASALRRVLAAHRLGNEHPLDLLEAFRRDVTKTRYADWAELMDYCRYSAMPVGRFVLDVHGESRDLWPLNDALCAALQVINHLQDCAKDYRALDRVYIPMDRLAAATTPVEALAGRRSSPGLIRVIRELAAETGKLLDRSRPFAAAIAHFRLGAEVQVIQTLAEDLNTRLLARDPLCDRVHHSKAEAAGLAAWGGLGFIGGRLFRKKAPPQLASES